MSKSMFLIYHARMWWMLACVQSEAGKAPGEFLPDSAPTVEQVGGGDTAPDTEEDPSEALFDPWTIHTIDLVMDAAAWADVRDNPWAENWQQADLRWNDETVAAIGVRAFGAGSMIAGKPSLKLSFDHFVDGQDWRGLEQVKLDNSSQDYGYMNERIGTEILRGMNVPASRTGWVALRVNDEAVGFFVMLEAIDDRFLERWYGDDSGPLYGMISGRWGQGLNPIDDVWTYYELQTSVQSDGAEIVRAAEVVASGTDAELAEVIDLDAFLRESVTRSLMGGTDTFSADGNNFYLYVDQGRLTIIPWDLDVEMGAWGVAAGLAVDPSAPWNTSPWSYNPVTGGDYVDPLLLRQITMGADLPAVAAEALEGPLAWAELDETVLATANLIRSSVYDDMLGYDTLFEQRAADLRLFLHARLSALAGGDVADCTPIAGATYAADLSPAGSVGWGDLLIDSTYWGPGFSVNGAHFCRGLFVHAPSTVTITVPAGKTTLYGKVGLQDWNQRCGDGATFTITQNGVTLYQSGALGNYSAAEDIGALPVSAGSVTLITSPNSEYSCDTTAWLDLRVE